MKRSHERVIHVTDGDTFETSEDSRPVRLKGVDTPERGEPGSKKATAALKSLILGKRVVIAVVASDKFSRRVANVWVCGTSVNEEMKMWLKRQA